MKYKWRKTAQEPQKKVVDQIDLGKVREDQNSLVVVENTMSERGGETAITALPSTGVDRDTRGELGRRVKKVFPTGEVSIISGQVL